MENNIFLDSTSKKIMNSTSGNVHSETRNIFKKHPNLNVSKKGEKIAKELDNLHNYRNLVDYDAEKPKNIKNALITVNQELKKYLIYWMN